LKTGYLDLDDLPLDESSTVSLDLHSAWSKKRYAGTVTIALEIRVVEEGALSRGEPLAVLEPHEKIDIRKKYEAFVNRPLRNPVHAIAENKHASSNASPSPKNSERSKQTVAPSSPPSLQRNGQQKPSSPAANTLNPGARIISDSKSESRKARQAPLEPASSPTPVQKVNAVPVNSGSRSTRSKGFVAAAAAEFKSSTGPIARRLIVSSPRGLEKKAVEVEQEGKGGEGKGEQEPVPSAAVSGSSDKRAKGNSSGGGKAVVIPSLSRPPVLELHLDDRYVSGISATHALP